MDGLSYRATVVGFRGNVLRVFDVPAEPEYGTPAAWLFALVYRTPQGDYLTGAKLTLWPSDLIRPVRDALAAGRDVNMKHYARDERLRKAKERAEAKVFVEASDANDDLARELGIL